MNIHLIDGTYELFRAFYGPPSAKMPDGREVGAARGLLRSLIALLRQEDVTHVAVAFDHVIESFRNELFSGYKTGEGIDPDLLSQFPLAEQVSRSLGIVTWPMVEFEADDALATAAARWAESPEVDRILLCSPDKDLAQCVRGQRVVISDRMRELEIDEDGVVAKWGVLPKSIPDYLALVGDSADGIPGIARWGAKSTAAVLSKFGSLDDIPDEEADWDLKVRGAKSLATNLREQREAAVLYRRLATLRTDVPLTESLEDLRWKGPDRPALEALCEEIGDQRSLTRVPTV